MLDALPEIAIVQMRVVEQLLPAARTAPQVKPRSCAA